METIQNNTVAIEPQDNSITSSTVKTKEHITLAERLQNHSVNDVYTEWNTGTVGRELL